MAKNYEVGNIEMNIKAMSQDALKSFDDVIKKIDELTGKLDGVTSKTKDVGRSNQRMANDIKKPTQEMKNLNKEVDELGNKSEKSGSKLRKAFNIGGALFLGKKFMQSIDKGLQQSTALIQNYRMLEVASGDYFDQALKFQDQLTSSFGINSKDALGVQGYFETLTSSLGIANKESSAMGKNLTQLTYDLASFFGEDFGSMYTKLQSGLVGQTKPLRGLGIDVTQQTMQGYLDSMNIDMLVSDLNQAEKVLLRYIAIIDQSQLAHGNLARSIEMPAQQIQVLKQQVAELGMWLWNVFIGTIDKILPYINGFIMALKEMIKALALLFGFDLGSYSMGEFDRGVGFAEDMGSAVADVGKQADKTGKKIKKMMGLFSFDEITNVQTPDDSQVGGVGGIGGGAVGLGGGAVYDDLLAQLAEYDNLMGNVQMKATDIRNRLLDWLGFLYDINEETGKLENLRWGGFGEMATSAKILAGILAGLAGYKIWTLLDSVYKSKGFTWLASTAIDLATNIGLATLKFFEFEWLLNFINGFSFSGIISSIGSFGEVLLTPLKWLTEIGMFLITGIAHPIETIGIIITEVGSVISTALASPLAVGALVIGLITAIVVAVVQLWDESEEFRNAWLDVWDGIKDSVQQFIEFFTPFFTTIQGYFNEMVTEGLAPLWEGFKELVKQVGIAIAEIFKALKPFIDFFVKTFGGTIALILTTTISAFLNFAKSVFSTLGKLMADIGQIIRGITQMFTGIIDFLVGIFTGDWEKAWAGVKKIFEGMWNSLIGIVKFVWHTIIGMFKAGGSIFSGIAGSILNVFKTVTNGLIRGINSVIRIPFDGLNRLLSTMREISILGAKPFSWMPRIYVPQIPSFKTGGFPDGENGLFYANDSEMVGKFSNGRTAVANNDQIVEGIKQGVEIGVMNAMANTSSSDGGITNVYLDSRLIAKEQKKRELELEMIRG